MPHSHLNLQQLSEQIKTWAWELGFQQTGIAGIDLSAEEPRLQQWLAAGYHGEMMYMAAHGNKRTRPAELVPGTLRVISLRMDYAPPENPKQQLANPLQAYISRYALGRDYHKVVRKRLQHLGERIQQAIGPFGFRAFVDSAPVMERALAQQAGLGWTGKNTLLLNPKAGSWFFLGELFVDLPLPEDPPQIQSHCGSCQACLQHCPTGALVGEGILDARRCISYLTIELQGHIPKALRPLLGNRVFGCDDCQLRCPWNRFANPSTEPDFHPRHGLDQASLVALAGWTEAEFLARTAGSPLRRIGYERWLRNLAVGLGNAPTTPEVLQALQQQQQNPSPLVQEHAAWALAQHKHGI